MGERLGVLVLRRYWRDLAASAAVTVFLSSIPSVPPATVVSLVVLLFQLSLSFMLWAFRFDFSRTYYPDSSHFPVLCRLCFRVIFFSESVLHSAVLRVSHSLVYKSSSTN